MREDRRGVVGATCALVGVAVLSGAMLPLRSHLSIATTALVLVVPVVLGVATGGFLAGAVAVIAGFLAYDLLFIPPYYTLAVGASQNYVALGVYVVVMAIVARVVAILADARAEARRREEHARRLLELSEVLVGDSSLAELLEDLVTTVQRAFDLRSAAVLLPPGFAGGDELVVAASAGVALDPAEVRAVSPVAGRLHSADGAPAGSNGLAWFPLSAAGAPVGVLAIAGVVPPPRERELLRTYANHVALALERARLREQAVSAQLLAEADRWRQALLGAVSHDLRTPLATIKAALSELRRDDPGRSPEDERELRALAEGEADRLERLVANLLDMTQIRAGTLRLRRAPTAVDDLVADALAALGPSWPGRLALSIPLTLAPVNVDHVLMVQVLANLLENAGRHAPPGTPVRVGAVARADAVEIVVEDRGPGVPAEDRERIFAMFNRVSGGGRAGLGLTIAKAFVEAHGGEIRVEERSGGGARFVFSLPRSGAHLR